MAVTPTNPKVEKICQDVHNSYAELVQLVDGPVTALEPEKLYIPSSEDEWSIMQNLAHIVEFMPYWAGEIEKLVTAPGQNFGRTAQNEGRLRAISEHGRDRLEQVKAALPASYTRLEEVLGNLQDSDLELTGHHYKFGEKSLEWFIEDFVTGHLKSHVDQIKTCLTVANM
ncbi:MAG TPA: DinB family protein [Ktedonobacteraceae bacterium]|nr:DinB family protein [Ktedonobacteraceae bacterium]